MVGTPTARARAKVRLPDGLIAAACEIMGLAAACVGVFILAGVGWTCVAVAFSLWVVSWIIGE